MNRDDLHVDIDIGSRFENIDLVDVVSEALMHFVGLDEDSVERLGLAIREAVANGVQHGNSEDPAKRVTVSFVLSQEQLRIQIKDQGEGFDVDSLPDPLDPQNLFKPRGRGILLMNSFMDAVDYTFEAGVGTTVTLEKKIEASNVDETEEGEA